MGSRKKSSWAKEKAAFAASLDTHPRKDGRCSTGNEDDFESDSWSDGAGDLWDALDAPAPRNPWEDLFARERTRQAEAEAEHDAALRRKACESKQRYATLADAQEAIEACAAHGTRGLRAYKCRYCNGWHLTSKPQ